MDDHAPEHAATVSQAMGSVTDFARAVMLLSEYVEVVRPPPSRTSGGVPRTQPRLLTVRS